MRETIGFSDLSHEKRFTILHCIEDAFHGRVVSYQKNGLQVAMPDVYSDRISIKRVLETFGYHETSSVYFPLGSDKPENHLRHIGPYQKMDDRPGYWMLYDTFLPKDQGK